MWLNPNKKLIRKVVEARKKLGATKFIIERTPKGSLISYKVFKGSKQDFDYLKKQVREKGRLYENPKPF